MADKPKTSWEKLKEALNPLGPSITESIKRRQQKKTKEEELDEED